MKYSFIVFLHTSCLSRSSVTKGINCFNKRKDRLSSNGFGYLKRKKQNIKFFFK
jgi:hypothetical protein